jgi:hypothetical protein
MSSNLDQACVKEDGSPVQSNTTGSRRDPKRRSPEDQISGFFLELSRLADHPNQRTLFARLGISEIRCIPYSRSVALQG